MNSSNDTLTALTEALATLPSIGPRQARRLAFWLVRKDTQWVAEFANAITQARNQIQTCPLCMRLYPKGTNNVQLCGICSSGARDDALLLLVERDVDLENIERTGAYSGKYFVLGGTTSPLDATPEKSIRIESLMRRLQDTTHVVREVIFALSATTAGEDTALYLADALKDVLKSKRIAVSRLGRGLSTGTELEYVDKDTMVHALNSRG